MSDWRGFAQGLSQGIPNMWNAIGMQRDEQRYQQQREDREAMLKREERMIAEQRAYQEQLIAEERKRTELAAASTAEATFPNRPELWDMEPEALGAILPYVFQRRFGIAEEDRQRGILEEDFESIRPLLGEAWGDVGVGGFGLIGDTEYAPPTERELLEQGREDIRFDREGMLFEQGMEQAPLELQLLQQRLEAGDLAQRTGEAQLSEFLSPLPNYSIHTDRYGKPMFTYDSTTDEIRMLSGNYQSVAEWASTFDDTPYIWGGESVETGADCGGLATCYLKDVIGWEDAPRITASSVAPGVGRDQGVHSEYFDAVFNPVPGDFVIWNNGTHMGVVTENGMVSHMAGTANDYTEELLEAANANREVVGYFRVKPEYTYRAPTLEDQIGLLEDDPVAYGNFVAARDELTMNNPDADPSEVNRAAYANALRQQAIDMAASQVSGEVGQGLGAEAGEPSADQGEIQRFVETVNPDSLLDSIRNASDGIALKSAYSDARQIIGTYFTPDPISPLAPGYEQAWTSMMQGVTPNEVPPYAQEWLDLFQDAYMSWIDRGGPWQSRQVEAEMWSRE